MDDYIVSVPFRGVQMYAVRASSKKEAVAKAKGENGADAIDKNPCVSAIGISDHGQYFWSKAKAEKG